LKINMNLVMVTVEEVVVFLEDLGVEVEVEVVV
jgi:hypothetical protein